MKVALVTGATGFIGQYLCPALIQGGTRVVVLGRNKPGASVESHFWDMTDVPAISAMAHVDTIFHLAGKAHALAETKQDEGEYFRVNVDGTKMLLEAAARAGVRRFIFYSSVKAMGEGSHECLDESAPCHPESVYGESKLAAEKLVMQGGYIPEPVVLRLSMVYGNSEKGNLSRMIRAVARGRFPPIPEVGNKRSMVHVDDVVRAAMLAAEKPRAIGQTYIVTDGTPYSTSQIYAWICEGLGKPVPSWSIPKPVWRTLARVGDGIGRLRGRRFMFDSDALDKLVGSACYSSHKIEKELGFIPGHHLHDSLPVIIRYLDGWHP